LVIVLAIAFHGHPPNLQFKNSMVRVRHIHGSGTTNSGWNYRTAIGKRAQEFALTRLRKEDMACYMYRLLLEFAAILD